MKRILIISCVFPPEPIVSAQLSLDIATELSKNNSVVVLSPKPTRPENFIFEQTTHKYPFEHIITDSYTYPQSKLVGRVRESFSFGKYCANYIQENFRKIDVIYLNSWPLLSQYFIVKAAIKHNIPCLTHVQDIYPESIANKLPVAKSLFYNLLLPIDKYVIRNSSSILCISENMKNQLQTIRKVSSERFEVVANWQNEDFFIQYRNSKREINSQKSKPFNFMYLGNNGPVAGVEFLIKSFYKAAIPDSQLIIAGSGSKTNDCKKLVSSLDIKNIIFIPVPDGKVPEIQDMADVMLLPVKKNGAMSSIPSKLPAYMFSAKPIIGSLDLESDTARAIREADCGLVVEPENMENLIMAMKEMVSIGEKELLQKGNNGFEYAMQSFSKKSNLKKVVNLISELA